MKCIRVCLIFAFFSSVLFLQAVPIEPSTNLGDYGSLEEMYADNIGEVIKSQSEYHGFIPGVLGAVTALDWVNTVLNTPHAPSSTSLISFGYRSVGYLALACLNKMRSLDETLTINAINRKIARLKHTFSIVHPKNDDLFDKIVKQKAHI